METSYFWDGTATGDASLAPYSADEFTDIWRKLFSYDRTVQGVIAGYGSNLQVTNPAGTTIRTASGAALVDGCFYENTANVDNSVVAPGSGSNYYRIVLRKAFASQTVRIVMLGPNTVSPPAVTQTDGTTWEISLATVQITSGSVVTVTDTRYYIHPNTYQVVPVVSRQGGSATDWSSTGTTNRAVTLVAAQAGSFEDADSGTSGSEAITFEKTFAYPPVIFAQCTSSDQGDGAADIIWYVTSAATTGFTVVWKSVGALASTPSFFWLAIGPMPIT